MLTEQARTKHEKRELYWAADLMVELETKELGRSLDWLIEAMRTLIEISAPPCQDQLMTWLQELTGMSKSNVDSARLLNASDEIWHKERDILHTAIAHLYAALAYLAAGNESWYRRSIVSATDVMGNHEYFQKNTVVLVLSLFHRFMEHCNTLTDKAREQYKSGDIYWPAKLVLELEDKAPGKALDWAIECAKALVENTSPDKKEQFVEWLAELSLAQNNPDSSALMEKAQQIWHEERTRLNTAISHLFAAMSYFSQGKSAKYRTSVIRAVNLMSDHDFYRQTSVEIPLALFEKFASPTS